MLYIDSSKCECTCVCMHDSYADRVMTTVGYGNILQEYGYDVSLHRSRSWQRFIKNYTTLQSMDLHYAVSYKTICSTLICKEHMVNGGLYACISALPHT